MSTYQIDPAGLAAIAATHTGLGEQTTLWAVQPPIDPARFHQSHGNVAYGSYIALQEHLSVRELAGLTFAGGQHQVAGAVRDVASTTTGCDTSSGQAILNDSPSA